PNLQSIDALLKGRNASSEFTGIGRHTLARLLDPNPARLRFMKREIEVLDRAPFAPDARLERLVQPEIQNALDQSEAIPQLVRLFVIGRIHERRFELLDARPLLALLRRTERGDIAFGLDRIQTTIEIVTRLLVTIERAIREHRIGARQPLR